MKRNRAVLAVLLVVVSLAGCAARVKNVTDLPPGVTQKQAQDWDAAVQDLQKIAAITSTARTSIIELHTAGLLKDGPPYVTALTVVGKMDELQLAASNVLKQSPNNFTDATKAKVKDYLMQISAQIQTLNQTGVTGIKNPNSQQQISDLITQITALVTLILSL
jgi:PBP1b-binding outer membrane lipoprotein LpoB